MQTKQMICQFGKFFTIFSQTFFLFNPFSLSNSPSFSLFAPPFFSIPISFFFFLLLSFSFSFYLFLPLLLSISLSLSLSLSLYLSFSLYIYIYTPIFLILTIYLPFLSLLYWSVLTEKRVYHRVSITFTRMQTLLHIRQPYHDWIRSLNLKRLVCERPIRDTLLQYTK